MSIPADQSLCTRCEIGKVRRHSGGATCQYCGRTWHNLNVLVEFQYLQNGEMFIVPEEYPESSTRNAADTEKVVWVKAMNSEDFPVAKTHWRENAYRADKPSLQAIHGPTSLVIPVKPLENQLPTV